MRLGFGLLRRSVLIGLLSLLTISSGLAQIDLLEMDKLVNYVQTSPTPPATSNSYQLAIGAFAHSPTDFTAGTVSFVGPGSPATLPPFGPGAFARFDVFATKAAMDAAYPLGNYTFTLTGGTMGPKSALLTDAFDAYPQSIPALSANTFNYLAAGPDPSQATGLNFSSFVTGALASSSQVSISIIDTTSNQRVFSADLPSTATQVTVPPNTFVAGHAHNISLTFLNGATGSFTLQVFQFTTSATVQGGFDWSLDWFYH